MENLVHQHNLTEYNKISSLVYKTTLDMTCNIVAKYINTDIGTKLLNYEHQVQNNIQWNHQEANFFMF